MFYNWLKAVYKRTSGAVIAVLVIVLTGTAPIEVTVVEISNSFT